MFRFGKTRLEISLIAMVASFIFGTVAISATSVDAQTATTKPTTRRAAVTNAPPASVIAALKGTDEDALNQALDQIRAAAAKRGRGFAGPDALQLLLDYKRFDEAEEIALEIILSHAADNRLADFQKVRVVALMRGGKKEEALAAAKGYYNIISLAQTQEAVNLLADCLAVARPKEPGVGKRFISQQIAWATADPAASVSPGDAPATAPAADLGNPIFPTIKIDSSPFDSTIDGMFPQKYDDTMAKGNLLLLADRCSEAHDCFELGLNHTKKAAQSTWLIERVACAIRAEKGYVAPANAYVQSMQKQP